MRVSTPLIVLDQTRVGASVGHASERMRFLESEEIVRKKEAVGDRRRDPESVETKKNKPR